jgi:hypothetical protein
MLAPVTHILPLTTIVRRRMLPIPGQVTVKVGQKVNPGDVVAETSLAREHVLVEIARNLSLRPELADKRIKVKRGDRIAKGDLIAESAGGLFGREVLSPVDGRVIAAGGGQVLIETRSVPFELQAGISGTISQVMDRHGVIIRTVGALIQGVWGNGRIETGTLHNLIEKPSEVLTSDKLDVSLRGLVMLAGYLEDEKALHAAADLPVRGLILSSISVSLIPLVMQMRFPVIITEGFGRRDMNTSAYRLLSTNIRRSVSINAETDSMNGARPEIVIPLSSISQEPAEPHETDTFAPGQNVRLRRAPHAGAIGMLQALRPGLTQLPSGLRVPAADVRLETGENVIVPLVNMEVLG